jgi:hemerythrin-like domain-containing protein
MANPAAVPAMPAEQVGSNIMAANVSAAVGITNISTPVSMSILNLVVLDHNCVRAMYDAFKSPSTTLELKQMLAWNMIMALSTHAAKEELVLYPVVRSTLGAAAADHLLAEHTAVKTMLATLDTMAATDPNFDIQLRASMDSMIKHMQEEETSLLPQLAAVLNAETQLQLGIHFEAAKVRAPTRPHPEAANLPPFNETAFAAAKQVDVALDQARMPSLVPTSVGLSPLISAALTSAAAAAASPLNTSSVTDPSSAFDGSGGAGGVDVATYPLNAGLVDQGVDMTGGIADIGYEGGPAAAAGGGGGDGDGDGMEDVQRTPPAMKPAAMGPAVDTTDPTLHLGMSAGAGAPDSDTGMGDVGDDAVGAAGGMPGDLTGSAGQPAGVDSVGLGEDAVTADDQAASGAGDADMLPRKRPMPADLAPAGEPAAPLMAPRQVY